MKEKIPDELNMIICRKLSGNVWTPELMLKYFNEELQAKEICVPFKIKSSEKDEVKDKNRAGYTGYTKLQVVYIVKVMNQKVINVSIVQKITDLPSAKT